MKHKVSIEFKHGLGDAANFAHAIPLWTRRGYDVEVECTPDKACLFEAAGATIVPRAEQPHRYHHPPGQPATLVNDWAENKVAHNLTALPMAYIGTVEDLWPELLAVNLTLPEPDTKAELDAYLGSLPGKPILLHTRANTSPGQKNLDHAQERELYRELLDRFPSPLLLLDWDSRVARYAHYRVRHMLADFRALSLPELAYVMDRSALLIGVDSGPLHFARFTSCPAIGLWSGHQPHRFSIPRDETLHVAPLDGWASVRRHSFNIADVPKVDGKAVAWFAERMAKNGLAGALVVDNVLRKLNTWRDDVLSDRNVTVDLALAHLVRKKTPRIVETGCVRQADDWTAGFSTYLFGLFLRLKGAGRLDSVDLSEASCRVAREWTEPFRQFVNIHQGDSLSYLERHEGGADLVYLDSLDTTEPGCAEHGLEEAKRAVRLLGEDGLILIDDTPHDGGDRFRGKGALAVPWLLENGWQIKCAGYQVLLERAPEPLKDKPKKAKRRKTEKAVSQEQ